MQERDALAQHLAAARLQNDGLRGDLETMTESRDFHAEAMHRAQAQQRAFCEMHVRAEAILHQIEADIGCLNPTKVHGVG